MASTISRGIAIVGLRKSRVDLSPPWSLLSARSRSGLFLGRIGSEFAQRVNSGFIQYYKRESCVAVEKWGFISRNFPNSTCEL
jgi:hypothetical protein